MIAARPLHDMARGVGRNALDLPVAALAALAVAFVTFAMPTDLLNQLVGATHVSSFLSAAEPPLGFKARAGVGLAGAIVAFGLVFVLLRLIDRTGLERPPQARPARAVEVPAPIDVMPAFERERPVLELDLPAAEAQAPVAEAKMPEVEIEEPPRLRRRDAHPDAPARRPISASRDFGEPAPPFHASPPAREPEPAPQPRSHSTPMPQVWPEAAVEVPFEPGATPREVETVAVGVEPEPEPERAPEARPEPEPANPGQDASLADLMQRLESGLARRQARAPVQPQTSPAVSQQVFPEPREDRLQSAIESLQRYNARRD